MFEFTLSSPRMSITISKNRTEGNDCSRPKPFSEVFPMLFEALQITIRNGAAAASIILPVFVSYCLLGYGANRVLVPLSKDLVSDLAVLGNNPEGGFIIDESTRKSVRHFLVFGLVAWFFACAISIIFSVTTISLASESYTKKNVNTKNLFSRIGGKWKSLLITSFYMALISISLTLLFLTSIGIILVVAEGFLLVALIAASVILGGFCCLYVAAVWVMSLVVSVVEEGSCGLKAIDRAGELMRGKRLKGCGLHFYFVLSCGIIYIAFFAMKRKTGIGMIMIPRDLLIWVVKFLMFVMFTLFYHECRKCHDEEGGKAECEMGPYDTIDSVEEA